MVTCSVTEGTPASPICWPLTLILSPARSNVITWLTAGHEPGLRWPLGCSRPGSSAFVGSGSPQKGHVTLLWHVWFSTTLPQLEENNVLLNQWTILIMILTTLLTHEMEEQSETQYATIISDWPITSPVSNKDNMPFFLLSLLYFLQVQMQYSS